MPHMMRNVGIGMFVLAAVLVAFALHYRNQYNAATA